MVSTSPADATGAPAFESSRGGWRLFLPDAGRTASLDGLRGLAVLIVLASHFSNNGLLPSPGLSGAGKSGVYLFFVLSAFLLTAALLRRGFEDLCASRVWLDYALRRVLRIWPLYLVVLLASWWATQAGVAWWRYPMETASLWQHLALREGVSVLWSIPVEFTFYLWLPPLALALAWLRARAVPVGLQIALLVLLVAAAAVVWPPGESAVNDVRLGPYLGVFLFGMLAAVLDLRVRECRARPAAWGTLGVCALLAAVLGIPAVRAWIGGTAFDPESGQRAFVAWGVIWSALLLAVLHGPGWLRAPFAWRPLRWVGAVSFSLYLWHLPVLSGLRVVGVLDLAGPLAAPVALAAVLAVSALSYLLFERPWQGLRYGGVQRRPL